MTATLSPFQPADGDKARWRHCYELVVSRGPREQVTLHEVMELLDCDEKTACSRWTPPGPTLRPTGEGRW